MSKKIISIVAIILLVFFIVFTYAPCIFERDTWEVINVFGSSRRTGTASRDYYEVKAWYADFLGYLPIFFSIIGIVALGLQCFDKKIITFNISKKQISLVDILSLSPVISFASFLAITSMLSNNSFSDNFDSYHITYDPSFGCIIEYAVLIVASILCLLIAGGLIKEKAKKMDCLSADEIQKYRALLESGVITQEEFDAKKKQILGL